VFMLPYNFVLTFVLKAPSKRASGSERTKNYSEMILFCHCLAFMECFSWLGAYIENVGIIFLGLVGLCGSALHPRSVKCEVYVILYYRSFLFRSIV
jgi:hypothetical protein